MNESESSDCRGYHHGDLARCLLEAALEVIREKGVPQTSLREIARRAGVSPRAPYHHFCDKLALLAQVARLGFEHLDEGMRQAMDIQDPEERLTELGMIYIRFAREKPAEFQVMHWEELCDLEHFPDRKEIADRPFHYLLQTLSQIAGRPVPEEELQRQGLVAWATVHGLAALREEGVLAVAAPGAEEEGALRDLVERHTRMIVNVLAGCRETTPAAS